MARFLGQEMSQNTAQSFGICRSAGKTLPGSQNHGRAGRIRRSVTVVKEASPAGGGPDRPAELDPGDEGEAERNQVAVAMSPGQH